MNYRRCQCCVPLVCRVVVVVHLRTVVIVIVIGFAFVSNCFDGLHLPFAFFFFNDTATTEIYTLSLHDALPISRVESNGRFGGAAAAPLGVRPGGVLASASSQPA